MFIRPSSSGGGRGERGMKKGKLSAIIRFLSKETIQTTAGMAMGGRGSLPGSLSLSIFRVQLFARMCKSEKKRGRAWVRG